MSEHGEQRNYGIHPGSMGGPGAHSEHEQYCGNCNQWVFLSGAAGGLYWAMLHESKQCIDPADILPSDSPWLKKLRDKNCLSEEAQKPGKDES